jgi:uncharacterized protein YdaU (DUF1376 family)
MGKDPAFLFYPSDYIGGTMGMTFEEKGAYMELLMMQFNRGHMTERMIGQTIGQLWDNIKVKFQQDENGLWYNKRLDEEKEKRQKFTESRRNNISGKNQYSKKDKTTSKKTGHTTKRMENEDVNVNESKDRELKYPFETENFLKFWKIWKEYKRDEHKFNYKSIVSEQAALKQLANMSGGKEDKAIKLIEQSITNGWKGFFPIKNETSNSSMDSYKQELVNRLND